MPETANYAWRKLLKAILNFGSVTKPRGLECTELIGYTSKLDMNYPVVHSNLRKVGYKFQAAEAAWILSGDDKLATIYPYANHMADFSDDGVTLSGAYGPRVVVQLDYAAGVLLADPDSRQAVINIWRDNPRKSKDIPCTLSLQFLLRGDKLHCIATMRSSDAWLGWVYDVFSFTMIALAVLLRINRLSSIQFGLGTLALTAGSQHLYAKDLHAAKMIAYNAIEKPINVRLDTKFKDHHEQLEWLWATANTVGTLEALQGIGA